MLRRKPASLRSRTLTPSTWTLPDCGSKTRCRSASAVVLPAPVSPTNDGFAGQRREVEIDDGRPLAVIRKGDVAEFHQPMDAARIGSIGPVVHHRFGVEHGEELHEPRRVHEQAVDETYDLLELS